MSDRLYIDEDKPNAYHQVHMSGGMVKTLCGKDVKFKMTTHLMPNTWAMVIADPCERCENVSPMDSGIISRH